MSNTILNIRFGSYHLQVVRFGDWLSEVRMGRSPITWRRNGYHDLARCNDPSWRWFQVY